ncbi:MAG: vanomycin resistance protein VanB [Micromonosporaceae bacterium]|nr:vanomycin resistance protein VanB [Micromonosporaceae bacterium]
MKLPRPPRAVILAAAGVILLLSSGLGLTATYAYAGEVPRGTSVLGVDLGAKSRADAAAALRAGLAGHAEALAAPAELQVGEASTQVEPAAVGLAVDVDATVAKAADSPRNPFVSLFGNRQVTPVVSVDAAALHEALQAVAKDVGEAMTMPEIQFDGTEPVPVYPEPGLGLDPDRSAQAVAAAWPPIDPDNGQRRSPAPIAVPLVGINPVTTAEDVDRLVAELAEPAVAAPVTIRTDEDVEVEAPPAVIAASLRLTADERGEIIPAVDGKALRKALGDRLAEVERKPIDAKVVLGGDGPEVVKSKDGIRLDLSELSGELLAVLPEPAPRAVTAQVDTTEPEVSTEQVEALGIEQRVSTFTTYFEGGLSVPRNHNIALVADLVDGALVPPGEMFSLNGHTGERDYDQGFEDAPVIIGGKLVPAVGGGISQFTTTLFNASYYAGLEDIEHHPHSYHYTRYPAVIESTIFYPDLDMQFRNNTDYGILIDTSYDQGSITVSMWSTPVWDEVTTEWSSKRDITKPKIEYLKPGPKCIATEGIDGFTQDAWRILIRDGQEVEREKFTWRYDAQPEFICGEKPGEDDN